MFYNTGFSLGMVVERLCQHLLTRVKVSLVWTKLIKRLGGGSLQTSGYTGEFIIIAIALKFLSRRGLFNFLTKDSIINIDHTCYVQDIDMML